MLVITTSISGSGRKDYLKDFEALARRNGKKVRIYHVGQMMFEQAEKVGVNISPENVLNANPYVLNSLRSAVFETIIAALPQSLKVYDAVIINVHSFFFWKKIFIRAYDHSYLNRLNPDMFLTFIDDAFAIKERLDKREQWKAEKLSIEELLLWQNVEVEVSASWAEFQRKPFYAVSARQTSATLFHLLFTPKMDPIYISMPMTHLPEKEQSKVTRLTKILEKYFVVFDPRNIEVDTDNPREKIDTANYNQTVMRDLYWLVRQSKKIIAYFPKLVASPGVINELREGYETNKDVWVIYPEETASPFLTYFCSRLFKSEEEFLKFLTKKYKPAKPLK